MTHGVWWMPAIDFRISAGIVFFLILLLWARGESRGHLALRRVCCLALLCGTSWCTRYVTDVLLVSAPLNALGYSVLILFMCAAFALCHSLCYRTSASVYIYCTIVALTLYRLAWNTLKALTAAQVLLGIVFPWTGDSPANGLGSYCIYSVVILLFSLPFRDAHKGFGQLRASEASRMAAFLIACHMALEFLYRFYAQNDSFAFLPSDAANAFSLMFYVSALVYCVISYILLMMRLHVSRLERRNADMEAFIRNKQRYYEMSRDGITSLQTQCHDLKHQIALLRSADGQRQFEQYIAELEDSIDAYNTVIECGNESIDVVLTEKNIRCQRENIRFTYIIDGALFSFMDEMDVYALFGNVMDNAIESASCVADPAQRFISLKAAQHGGMVVMRVENSFEHTLEFRDGMPVTNKPEKHHHGFGLRSIRAIAEKYGGSMAVHAEERIFRLTVTLTAPGQSVERDIQTVT